ncbi:nucleotidyltransferase family protein, partial [Pelagibacteraceae bacterium]|nr:nucleotidyltransferase family protein [Pelagibacteraceae bacterium]
GLHITNRSFLFEEKSKVFSMNKIWNNLIEDENLQGLESNQKFYHLNTFEMYKKISSLNITD